MPDWSHLIGHCAPQSRRAAFVLAVRSLFGLNPRSIVATTAEPEVKLRAKGPIGSIAGVVRPNAAAFIVTIYGDVVVPRGGVMWTGTLIDLCAKVGISETLVRTAVSRLVVGSQLEGERIGRRSYYRLRNSAEMAFQQAADLLYGPDRLPSGWQIIHDGNLKPGDAQRQRMGHMGGSVYIRPDRGQPVAPGAVAFHAEAMGSGTSLAEFWDLTALRDGYERFIGLFGGLDPLQLRGADALAARLLLVHAYRFVLLRDPRLPTDHLPKDWNAKDARILFQGLYRALSPAAHSYIARFCEGVGGLLPEETAATIRRSEALVLAQ